ncbi:MAG: T9SS type A sorting domain-containing protein, partial [Rhodothermales bacterium]
TDLSPEVTLSWQTVGGADTYHVQVSTSVLFSAIVAEASDLTAPSFQAANLDLDTTYFWRVSATNILGVSDWSDVWRFTVVPPPPPPPPPTGVELEEKEIPTTYRLGPNYPNPFNPTTTIPFALPNAARVIVEVYDVTGATVATLVDEPLAAGRYTTTWETAGLASGVYVVRMRAGDFVQTRKMILLK